MFSLAGWIHAQQSPTAKAGWDADWFQKSVSGSWTGTGSVYGNEVRLTREWSLDLKGQFLRADMKVEMGSMGSFRALAFWRIDATDRYAVTCMDEIGQKTTFDAIGYAEAKEVRVYSPETTDDSDTPEWRRTVYRVVGDDEYHELMFRETSEGWEQIADFRFTREKSE